MYLTKIDFMLARDCPTKLFYKKRKYISSSGDDDLAQFLQDCVYMISTMAKLLHPGGHEMVQRGARARSLLQGDQDEDFSSAGFEWLERFA